MGNTTQLDSLGLRRLSPLLLDLQNHFLQVRTLAESSGYNPAAIKEIELVSKHALIALDYALFAVEGVQAKLPFTSVSAAAAATNVAESLRMLAKTYDVDLRLDVTKKLEPVYANEAALKGALYGLASSLITANSKTSKKRSKIIVVAQETMPKMQRVGVYSPDVIMPPAAIKLAKTLAYQARFVAPKDLHHSGLGLVISDQLSQALGSNLKRFVHRGQKGIGFYVPMSGQLGLL